MDFNRFSRQISALGSNTCSSISQLKVGILYTRSIGWEAAKCLALMGVHSIYILDLSKTLEETKGLNPAIPELYKSLTIGFHSVESIKIINPAVNVFEAVDLSMFKLVDVILITSFPGTTTLDNLIKTHIKNTPFIFAHTSGFCGFISTHFNNHTIINPSSEKPFQSRLQLSSIGWTPVEPFSDSLDDSIVHIYINNELTKSIESPSSLIFPHEMFSSDSINSIKIVKKPITFKFPTINQMMDSLDDCQVLSSNLRQNKKLKFYKNFLHNSFYGKPIFNTDEEIIDYQNFSFEFYPIGALLGGIMASEAIKITGQLTPIQNGIFFDYTEIDINNDKLLGGRRSGHWRHINNLLSKDIIHKIRNSKLFLVGAGALGCEHIKNLAMIDACSGRGASVSIVDMDTIAVSNLSRQFLYNDDDVGRYKTEVLKEKIENINPGIIIQDFRETLGVSSEKIFNREFWESIDFVINGLDNIETRLYVDEKCQIFRKPLFECGTMGNKLNVQTIIPYQTATYSEIKDIEQSEIPFCTIRNFPYKVEHCVEWSMQLYNKLFVEDFIVKNKLIWLDSSLSIKERTRLFSQYLIQKIHEEIVEPIQEIQKNHPKTDETFWSGNRRYPELPSIQKLMESCFNHYSSFIPELNKCKINWAIMEYNLSQYTKSVSDTESIEPIERTEIEFSVVQFEKDNYESMDIIHQLTNFRCLTYKIPLVDFEEICSLAWRIVPALATTTTVASALTILEWIKHLANEKTPCDWNVNLDMSFILNFNSNKPKSIYTGMTSDEYPEPLIVYGDYFNGWTQLKIDIRKEGIRNTAELVQYIKNEFIMDDEYNIISLIENQNVVWIEGKSYSFDKKWSDRKEYKKIEIIAESLDGKPIMFPRLIVINW